MYTSQRIEIRNQEIFSGRSSELISQDRANFSINLRKSHRQLHYMKQRMKDTKSKSSREMSSLQIEFLRGRIKVCLQEISSNSTNEAIVFENLTHLKSIFTEKKFFKYFWECETFTVLKSIWNSPFSLKFQIVMSSLLICLSVGDTPKCMKMVENGLISKCFEYLENNDFELTDNAIWVLNNLTIANKEISSDLLKDVFVMKLVELSKINDIISKTKLIELLSNLTWIVKNDFRRSFMIIQVFTEALSCQMHVVFCVIGFFRLSNSNDTNLKEILRLNPEIIENMTQMTGNEPELLLINSLKLLSCFTYNSEMTEKLLDQGILPFLLKMFQSSSISIRKEAFFLFSNMLAETEQNIMVIVAHKPLILALFEGIHEFAYDVRKEVWFCIKVLTKNYPFLNDGFYDNLIFNMNLAFKKETDPSILALLLESYENLIENSGSLSDFVKELLFSSQCFDSMSLKRQHGNRDVANFVERILDKFYDRNELYEIPDDLDEFN
jgi:hypothetical protein